MVGGDSHLTVPVDAVGTFRVLVTVPAAAAPSSAHPVRFLVRDQDGHVSAEHEAVVVGPGR